MGAGRVALALIGKLFRIEREVERLPRKQKERLRAKKSKKVVDSFFAWCTQEVPHVLDDSSEREIRRQAVGRKNWLFVGSNDGARANTTFVSLVASCQLHGIEPWGYLRDLFGEAVTRSWVPAPQIWLL